MKTSQIFLAAADVIEQRGLYQGGDYAPPPRPDRDLSTCPVCVVGAFRVVCRQDRNPCRWSVESHAASVALFDWLGDTGWSSVPAWSDNTPQPAVLRALREAAAQLEAEASDA